MSLTIESHRHSPTTTKMSTRSNVAESIRIHYAPSNQSTSHPFQPSRSYDDIRIVCSRCKNKSGLKLSGLKYDCHEQCCLTIICERCLDEIKRVFTPMKLEKTMCGGGWGGQYMCWGHVYVYTWVSKYSSGTGLPGKLEMTGEPSRINWGSWKLF